MVFAGAIAWTSLAGLVLAVLAWNVLLMVIAVFTFFLVYIGVRAIRLRRGGKVIAADGMMCGLAAAFSAWLLWSGIFDGDVTSLVFGAAGMGLALRQDHALSSAATNWTAMHLGTMGGAYIATVTAVLVVNLTTAPKPLVFLGPAAIGTPLLVWTGRHYRRREAAQPVSAAADLPA
jgi:hypothetical protein